jgi:Putative zinc-finger
MQCSEFDALLSQAIDGTLEGDRLTAFEAHSRECGVCGPLLQEADAGRSWLKSLQEVEPSEELMTNILLRTSGVRPAKATGQASWFERVRELAGLIVAPIVGVARQPRFAMSFGMAFFTLSVSLSLAGVRIGDLRHVSLRPSTIRRSYYEASGRVVKYYENIRFVYEIESRVRQFKQTTTPAEPRRDNNNNHNHNRKENKDNTSGQPDQKQERNYSQGGGVTVYASLTDEQGPRHADLLRVGMAEPGFSALCAETADPPVVHGATYRRFV